MFGKIKIGKTEMDMVVNAATPYWFSQVFHEDFFIKSQEFTDGNEGGAVDLFSKMGYIMTNQADGADLRKLSLDGYIEWLEQFEVMDMAIASADIAMLYAGQTKTNSKAKN